jgi:methylphosphotriester-DNA--protein-cysteine methyltransferase
LKRFWKPAAARYFDQAHLTRVFKQITGATPRPLLNELRCVFFQAASWFCRYKSARDV